MAAGLVLKCLALAAASSAADGVAYRQSDWSASKRPFHVLQPVGGRRDDAHIFGQMLERERLDGNGNAVSIDDGRSEMADGFLNSLASGD